ncbi:MAG TPA: hypothetical protein VFK47_07020, partial [Ktedonobacteraceae bacterium]|nr:hypothetical protein [Ktedonobacteraceae bacterium]
RENVEDGPTIQLARMLVNRASWGEIVGVLEQLKDENPEGIRRVLEAYVTKVVLNDHSRSKSLTPLLDMLTYPIYGNSIASIIVISSRWIFGR